jgi:hypothetical protein
MYVELESERGPESIHYNMPGPTAQVADSIATTLDHRHHTAPNTERFQHDIFKPQQLEIPSQLLT